MFYFFMPNQKYITVAFIMAIVGVVLFSAKAVMVKMSYEYSIDPVSLLLLRMSFSLPLYLLIWYFWGKPPADVIIRKRDYLGVVGAGIFGYYLASLFDFQGLQYISASLERLILFTYPTIVILISRYLLKEQITKAQYLGIGVTYTGMLIIFGPQLFIAPQKDFWLGAGLIMLSAVTYAFYLVSSGYYMKKFGTIRFTSMALSISALCIIIHFLFMSDLSAIASHPQEVYWLGGAMAIFSTVIPTFLIAGAIKRIGASSIAVVGSLGPVSTIALAIIFLGETLTTNQVIGALVVILGVLWISLRKK
jgi:drug/metabolite transporter (DMT)-like permease